MNYGQDNLGIYSAQVPPFERSPEPRPLEETRQPKSRGPQFEPGSDGPVTCSSIQSAMQLLASPSVSDSIEHIFVIGGGQVYSEAIRSELCAAIHLTQIDQDFECDTYFPEVDQSRFKLWSAAPPRKDGNTCYSYPLLHSCPELSCQPACSHRQPA